MAITKATRRRRSIARLLCSARKAWTILSFLYVWALLFVQTGYCTTFSISNPGICVNEFCDSPSPQTSYTGPNAGTGESDYSGVIQNGATTPFENFDSYGWICLASSSPDCLAASTAGLTISRETNEFPGSGSNYFSFLDTFTNSTGSTISGNIVFFGNYAFMQGSPAGDTATQVSYTNFLQVVQDSLSELPAMAFVTGNNAWAQNNISFVLNGDSPTYTFSVSLAPGQSISLLQFVVLAATVGSGGNVTPDLGTVASVAQGLLDNPFVGLSNSQIAGIVNFSVVPEPGTLGVAGLGLWLGCRKLPRRNRNSSDSAQLL
jgi:hypothetical protein